MEGTSLIPHDYEQYDVGGRDKFSFKHDVLAIPSTEHPGKAALWNIANLGGVVMLATATGLSLYEKAKDSLTIANFAYCVGWLQEQRNIASQAVAGYPTSSNCIPDPVDPNYAKCYLPNFPTVGNVSCSDNPNPPAAFDTLGALEVGLGIAGLTVTTITLARHFYDNGFSGCHQVKERNYEKL
jgi:hypothetical protein